MPIPTPLHSRTSELCRSLRFKDWSGYYAVCAYDVYAEREYFALRHAAGLIDVSPLYKYDVLGPDAEAFVSRLAVRDAARLKVNQVAYCCWCDDAGKVVDDGTVARFAADRFRLTTNQPFVSWLSRHRRGYDVTVRDVSDKLATLALQGPSAREILKQVTDVDVDSMRFFWMDQGALDGAEVVISRTGYTGDLGFEIWADSPDALRVWDAVMDAGRRYGLAPAGLDAMDITRIEAGFILAGVDYYHAPLCLIEKRKSTPYELGLGWMVKLDRAPFVGQAALCDEAERGPARVLVGLELDWDEYAALFAAHRLPPELCAAAWRTPVPVYASRGRQVGYATSGAWSATLKKNLALATVRSEYAALGTTLRFEVTVEYERKTVQATVVSKPFFDPERKKALA